ncbi:MAG: aldolase/citrate lyase family protein [Novosphingobium sp.]|nr:aldolase/citrate lyase family protein [Novosphingobium sp.]
MRESLKQRMAAGEKLVGAVMLMSSPDVAEVLSFSGLGFVMIDHEHGAGGLHEFIAQSRAMKGSDLAAMVRIPSGDFRYAARLLDNGARAIVCPSVDTQEEAQAFVRACRYPPNGERGAGAGLRGAAFGTDADYYSSEGEAEALLIAQIESERAVENVDAICAVDGIDMLLIGPRDLSASIGKLNRFDDPQLLALLEHAEQRILASGKYLASTLHQGKTCSEMFAAGYSAILAGKDVDFLLDGARALMVD